MADQSSSPAPPVRARVRPLDWLMLALAIISVALLCYETWWPIDELTRQFVLNCDYLLCALFAVEFLWRWRAEGWKRNYLTRNWYEIIGMIPVAHPAIRAFRLFRVIRIVILLSRFGMAADRAVGDDFTYRLVNRFKTAIVNSISNAVTIAVIEEVKDVLSKGTYTQNISRALQENQNDVRAMILEKLRNDPQTGRLKMLPFYNDIVSSVLDAALRVIEEVLKDPRTDELVADMLRENLTQLQSALVQQADQDRKAG